MEEYQLSQRKGCTTLAVNQNREIAVLLQSSRPGEPTILHWRTTGSRPSTYRWRSACIPRSRRCYGAQRTSTEGSICDTGAPCLVAVFHRILVLCPTWHSITVNTDSLCHLFCSAVTDTRSSTVDLQRGGARLEPPAFRGQVNKNWGLSQSTRLVLCLFRQIDGKPSCHARIGDRIKNLQYYCFHA